MTTASSGRSLGFVGVAAIFEHVLKVPNGQLHNGHSKTLAGIMRRMDWEPCVFKLDGKSVRGYRRTKYLQQ